MKFNWNFDETPQNTEKIAMEYYEKHNIRKERCNFLKKMKLLKYCFNSKKHETRELGNRVINTLNKKTNTPDLCENGNIRSSIKISKIIVQEQGTEAYIPIEAISVLVGGNSEKNETRELGNCVKNSSKKKTNTPDICENWYIKAHKKILKEEGIVKRIYQTKIGSTNCGSKMMLTISC